MIGGWLRHYYCGHQKISQAGREEGIKNHVDQNEAMITTNNKQHTSTKSS
jgi:hypothetical protein